MDKNKTTRKFNFVDIIIVAAVLIVAVFAVMKFTGNSAGVVDPTKIEYVAMATRVEQEIVDNLDAYVPGQLMASGELLNAHVVSYEVKPAVHYIETADGQLIEAVEENRYDVYFTVQGYVQNATTSELGTQEVRLGKTHILKTVQLEFNNTTIVDIKWGDDTSF